MWLLVIGLLASCCVVPILTSSKSSHNEHTTRDTFTDQLQHFMLDENLSTVSTAVLRDGHVVYNQQLVRESTSPAKPDFIDSNINTRHGLNQIKIQHPRGHIPAMDISHLLASLCILTLERDGHVNLQQPLFGKHGILIEETTFADDRVADTQLIHVLQQTVGWGIRDMKWSELVEGTQQNWARQPLKNVLDRVLDVMMMWPPGAAYNFSVTNEYLLRHIVEKVSGKDYETYTKENILKPLGLRHTNLVPIDEPVEEYTMPLLSSLWQTSLHDVVQILLHTAGDTATLGVDLSLLYARPEPPYPPQTRLWHTPTYFLNKQGVFWGESVTSNGHYLFIYHSGTRLTRQADGQKAQKPEHETMLVLYARGTTHRHFKPLLVDMLKETPWMMN